MLRPVTTVLLALALGVLPVVHDVCGPECEMDEEPVVVVASGDAVAAGDRAAECPLHPAKDDAGQALSDPPKAPAHEADPCTHDHDTVREAPESPSALAPSVPQSLELPVAAFAWTAPYVVAEHRGHAVVSPPFDRAPQLLTLRV